MKITTRDENLLEIHHREIKKNLLTIKHQKTKLASDTSSKHQHMLVLSHVKTINFFFSHIKIRAI
jgi:hypothetical protein